MQNKQQLALLKDRIKESIRRNTKRSFISSGHCTNICMDMISIINEAGSNDAVQAFDIYSMVLLEAIKLISIADTSSGAAGDVIYSCHKNIEKLCKEADEDNYKYFFETIIKTAKNKAFKDWPEDGYTLLKNAACFVRDQKQAQKIYEVFSVLGKMYDGREYPDKLLITLCIIERLEGKEAAEKYTDDNIHVPEMRKIAVEKALACKNYTLAEKLCIEILNKDGWRYYDRNSSWPYFLEAIYLETANDEKFLEIIRFILFKGNTDYYQKLKELYIQQNTWEQMKEPLLQELAQKLMPHVYASLLSNEGEMDKLLNVIKEHKYFITDYGKQLAESLQGETYKIYDEYIMEEAKEAADRIAYKKVCKYIKNFNEAGGREQVLEMIERLKGIYPRRPAMLDELEKLKKKINKEGIRSIWGEDQE